MAYGNMKRSIMRILGDRGADGCEESAHSTKSEPFLHKNHDNALQSSW